ncbi:MAG: PEP-CTERM sorting domain-containing protein [Terriglobia bacterium]
MHKNITSNPALAVAGLFMAASMASIPAQADLIPFTFNLTGIGSTTTGSTATTLSITSNETGSLLSDNPGWNAAWNPLTYTANEVVDLNTGLLNGTFSIAFADSSTIFGDVALDVAEVISPTGDGSFSGTLTFTGGTGEFAGATGSAAGTGLANNVSGSGTIDAPGVPEPAPIALTAIGIAAVLFRRIRKQSTHC